jgi:uncharacterized protein DUF4326/ParB-like nuclease family protein
MKRGMKPHPAAEVFPMLDEEELEELAADIKAKGLQQPLVVGELDGNPVLIDGRNRREACRRAGVIPDYVLLDGQDPMAYILSANINRRQLTRGQRAMTVIKVFATKTSHGDNRKISGLVGVSEADLSKARVVLHHASDLANSVINGTLFLDNAYEEARIRKGRAETHESRFESLKAAAPDLAEMVVEGRLSLEEAEAAKREREARERHNKKLTAGALHDLARHAYLLNHAYRDSTRHFVLSEAELYKQHNCGPIDEFIEALGILRTDINELETSLSPRKVDVSKDHKTEFRFLAENKAHFVAILEKYEGEAITRAALIAEIQESILREDSPSQWSEEELARREAVEAGITVVANLRGAGDKYLLSWAKSQGLLVRVDRGSPWGNPFEMPADGDRDTVCDNYAYYYLPHKLSLINKIHTLCEKVLACWCYPERCHGDYLAELANKDN